MARDELGGAGPYVVMGIKATSEFQTLMDAYRSMGIKAYHHWTPGDSKLKGMEGEKVQAYMLANGFYLTVHATSAILIDPLVHYFSCCGANMNKEGVESGSFMFTLNRETGEFTKHPTRTITATE